MTDEEIRHKKECAETAMKLTGGNPSTLCDIVSLATELLALRGKQIRTGDQQPLFLNENLFARVRYDDGMVVHRPIVAGGFISIEQDGKLDEPRGMFRDVDGNEYDEVQACDAYSTREAAEAARKERK